MIFTCSLFICLCSFTSNMTGYSHSYHLIKLIHCSAPQRDILRDRMVFWVVTHSLYFIANFELNKAILWEGWLLKHIITLFFLCRGHGVCGKWKPDFVSFLYKDKWWWLILFISCFASLLPGGGTPILGHIRYVRPEWVRFPGQNLWMGVKDMSR